ncbi:hypothetical protein K504DRAFT_401775 [Pleomassaria siparia CBS 279.74]|uniref:Pullulan synthetase n=1 Tax=Pleomassaria siparia CBS 279.74 TaxID=1314801 RepID=A0A6G1KJL5_9PLEO|nr:hypothetical protein K504DRAFT_401775 [Pleomassaria siparia CBS 279.74]
MRSSIFHLVPLLAATLCAAAPLEPTNFLLVTSNQSSPNYNSSDLQVVSATSLFDPYYQPALLLRLIGPGYGSLPNFTLTSGTLHTTASGPHGVGQYEYNSTVVAGGAELQFLASQQPQGNIALEGGYLVTVDGESDGWTVCDSKLSSRTLWWKGVGGNCTQTWLHAVTKAPY